jgi:purine-nucleoside phosphorylase
MTTPHNNAKKGQIAKTVLMPGDPLRAKFIADNFLQNAVLFNDVRGMLGYTGKYKGVDVSVMGHGMGIPSVGIYSYELYRFYDVENIIRVGSAGSYSSNLGLKSTVLATAAFSESTYAKVQNGFEGDTTYPSDKLNETILAMAGHTKTQLTQTKVHSSDVFYRDTDKAPNYWNDFAKRGIECVEMESFALFHNANTLGKNAACLLTISDSLVDMSLSLSAKERQTSLTDMISLALETAIVL